MRLARCLVPVWTGIGHESDFVLADAVAHTACKTPTETAQRILRISEGLLAELQHATQRLAQSAEHALGRREMQLRNVTQALGQATQHRLDTATLRLEHAGTTVQERSTARLHAAQDMLLGLQSQLQQAAQRAVELERRRLLELERTVHALDPVHTLARGFSIAWQDGVPIRHAEQVAAETPIQVQLHTGWLEATVAVAHATQYVPQQPSPLNETP